MGTPKALLRIGGETFLTRLIHIFSAYCDSVCVVLGHDADVIRAGTPVNLNVHYVVNEHYQLGQLSSLQCGLRAVQNESDAVLFCPVDVPGFETSTAASLVQRFRPDQDFIVAPRYQGRHGHPVLIHSALISEFLALDASAQARDVVHRHVGRTQYVDVEDAGTLKDIDDREAYLSLLSPTEGA